MSLRHQLATLPASWLAILQPLFDDADGKKLTDFVDGRIAAGQPVYPPDPFASLRSVEPQEIRVIILGQDPYHGPGQANGLAFSVARGQKFPPSLRNIFTELVRDGQGQMPAEGDLRHWAEQGVLLLNSVLTVERALPASHAGRGWERISDAVIDHLAHRNQAKVFMLWGAHAQAKSRKIVEAGAHNLVLSANHPSPLSARRPPVPFIGSGHFSRCNQFLTAQGLPAVRWLPADLYAQP